MGCTTSKGVKKHVKEAPTPVKQTPSPRIRRFEDCYVKGKDLGCGSYSVVHECYCKRTGRRAAVKVVNRVTLTAADEDALRTEVDILRDLEHPHIVRFFDFFVSEDHYHIVMELCEGGELFDRIVTKHHYNEKDARDLVRILLDILNHIHNQNVVHRDLKPENLLLVDAQDHVRVKLCDFGFAQRTCGDKSLKLRCGSPCYVAPEIVNGERYGQAVDVWSAGVITYILLGGYPPFYDDDPRKLYRKIRTAGYRFHSPKWDHVSAEAKDLISRLLVVDPDQRLTAEEALQHPWIVACDEVLVTRDLRDTVQEMKRFNARRKWRAACQAVMTVNFLQRSLSRSQGEELATSISQAIGAAADEGRGETTKVNASRRPSQ